MNKEGRLEILCLLLVAIYSPVLSGKSQNYFLDSLDALVSSCVVVPCTFSLPGGNLPASRLRTTWHVEGKQEDYIYHEDESRVQDNFKGRTRLLGDPGQNNCTLEITEIKNHDNGPFCFRIEVASPPDADKSAHGCVKMKMLPAPPDPELTQSPSADEGQPFTVTCTVPHTCPSHAPKLTWEQTVTAPQVTERQKDIRFGNWEVESTLVFIPEEKDDHTDITCTALFNGKKTTSKTMRLYVKRAVNYKYIIIPTAVGVGTAVIFGLLCVFMMKKYKKRIAELQNQEGSVWNRMSRLSRRFRSDRRGPSPSDQRGAIWSRFSSPNNAYSGACAEQKLNKPRFPSPKSQPKSCNYMEDTDGDDDYMNTADLNIYGNI
uniref:Myeloid cell surface antigen CD33-like n=1 Tax=Salarias fasciatus TaxID=181472 RepID=A0A672FXU6_SALFA